MDFLSILKSYGVTDENSFKELLKNLSEQEKRELIDAAEYLSKYNYKQYEPQEFKRNGQPFQTAFHISGAYIRAYIAANRTGKTWSCLHDLLWYLTGDYPDWFPVELKRETPFFGRWIATDFKHGIGEVFMPAFKKAVPGPYKDGPIVRRVSKNQTGVWTSIEFQNGSIETLMTNEQDIDDFEGASYHRLDIDEPCTHSRFIASARGLVDYRGRICMHLTPLSEPWIYDEVYVKAGSKKVFVVTAKMYDNKYNTKEAMKEFESNMDCDPVEKSARMEGEFKHLKGLVYKTLDRDVHQVKDFVIPMHWPVVHIMDPHDRKPHHMIWVAISEYNHGFVVAEMKMNGTPLEVSHKIKKFERDKGFRVNLRIGDPNKFAAPPAVGQRGSLKSEFAKYKMFFYTNVNDKIPAGHSKVRSRLFFDTSKPRRLGNQPSLYWFKEAAKDCFAAMLRYTFYEEKNKEEKGIKEKPREVFKDYPDTIRYFCMASVEYESMEKIEEEPDPNSEPNDLGW